jgi:hypothetical protein
MAVSNEVRGSGFLRREWRELGRLVLESIGAGLFVSLVLALAVFIVSAQQAHAAPAGSGQGTLYLKEGDGGKVGAPLLFTDVQMDVTGIVYCRFAG